MPYLYFLMRILGAWSSIMQMHPLREEDLTLNTLSLMIEADICHIVAEMRERRTTPAYDKLRDFMERAAGDLTRRKKGVLVPWSADMIILDFPLDTICEGGKTIPMWNKVTPGLFDYAFQLAAHILDDAGFVASLSNPIHRMEVFGSAKRHGLFLHTAFSLGTQSTFGKMGSPGHVVEIQAIDLNVFSRKGYHPQILTENAEVILPGAYSLNTNTLIHDLQRDTYSRYPSLAFVRSSAEKSGLFMLWLIEVFCRRTGVVVDMFAGAGPAAHACCLVGRNYVGIDIDGAALGYAASRLEKPLPKPVVNLDIFDDLALSDEDVAKLHSPEKGASEELCHTYSEEIV